MQATCLVLTVDGLVLVTDGPSGSSCAPVGVALGLQQGNTSIVSSK